MEPGDHLSNGCSSRPGAARESHGSRDRVVALQQIGNQHRRLADDHSPNAKAMQRPELVLAHQARDAVLAARLARFSEIEEHAWRPYIPWLARKEARINFNSRASSSARFDSGCFSQS
jgi:hypothetical protein